MKQLIILLQQVLIVGALTLFVQLSSQWLDSHPNLQAVIYVIFCVFLAVVLSLVIAVWNRPSLSGVEVIRALITSRPHHILQSNNLHTEPRIAVSLLRLLLPSEQEPHITGDLLEEFNHKKRLSRLKAYLWLYKQIFKSVMPLVYKNLKNRLASYFGERIR